MFLFSMIDRDLDITRALQQHSCMQCSSQCQTKEMISTTRYESGTWNQLHHSGHQWTF